MRILSEMRFLEDASFCVLTYCGRSQTDEKFGANGLPLTPVSIRIMGTFQELKAIEHPYLCRYLDISRGKYDQMFVVSEYHSRSLNNTPLDALLGATKEARLLGVAFQLLSALAHLHERRIVHRWLCPQNVFVTGKGQIRLAQYGLYHMTEHGADVAFPIGQVEYLAPEIIAAGIHWHKGHSSGPKSDVWSAGLVLLELCLGRRLFNTDNSHLGETIERLLDAAVSDSSVSTITLLFGAQVEAEVLRKCSPAIVDFLNKCLSTNVSKRPSAKQLLHLPCFGNYAIPKEFCMTNFGCVFRCKPRLAEDLDHCEYLTKFAEFEDTSFYDDPVSLRTIDEAYALWRIAGPDVATILHRKGLIKTKPPIKCIPNVVVDECEVFGREDSRLCNADLNLIPLSLTNLHERLKLVDVKLFYPSLELIYANDKGGAFIRHQSSIDQTVGTFRQLDAQFETSKLPAVIKEQDIEYQLKRQILFDRLICAFPFKKSLIWREARVDIPPLYRGFVWAALLDLKSDVDEMYDSIDKETVTATDRQIEVDIPRCHQYDELLSSPEGHKKFKRILKAWVASHPHHVYWQGLDSLCAPFLYLHFNDEALAYACLSAFIPKYLFNFFLKDNSAVIHEYLAIFSHLVAYHDPKLYMHLSDIGFRPELYAIPWFLTMFAHVFPLHKIFHLWDTLLLGNSSFPLFVGVSILFQLRDRLLETGFNECILLFSDLPEIDIQRCVTSSVVLFCNTPRSATFREHAPPVHLFRERSKTSSFISYSLEPESDLGMSQVPIEDLRSEVCPRICGDELLQLTGLKSSQANGKCEPNCRPKILIVDIRSKEEYMKGTFPDSVNIPYASAFNRDSGLFQLPPASVNPASERLQTQKGHIIVVIGSKGCSSANFGAELVKQGYPRVCSLHNDITVFKHGHTEVLSVPSFH